MKDFNEIIRQYAVKIEALSEMARTSTIIDPIYYTKYDVKKGLRDIDGKVCWQVSRKYPIYSRQR